MELIERNEKRFCTCNAAGLVVEQLLLDEGIQLRLSRRHALPLLLCAAVLGEQSVLDCLHARVARGLLPQNPLLARKLREKWEM